MEHLDYLFVYGTLRKNYDLKLKERLIAEKDANPDLRFVYLMAKRDGQVYFVVDSEDPSSEDYSPPGQEYTEASDLLRSAWDSGASPVFEIEEDRWGEWISALAPARNASGTTVALFGLDKSAKEHRTLFVMQTALVVIATISLLLLIGLLYFLGRREQELTDMKSDFVSVASHELRSPLSSMRWDLSELLRKATLPNEARGVIEKIYDRTCDLIERTGTLLQVTAVDQGLMHTSDMALIDLAAILKRVIARVQDIAHTKGIAIETNIKGPISVKGNGPHLQLVFDNLLSNAAKYSPEGSTVTFSYEPGSSAHVFTVQDRGMGIPPDDLRYIFSGFHRASNARNSRIAGAGFGLYIAKKIVEFHGGTITCVSEPGTGSLFTVRLPKAV